MRKLVLLLLILCMVTNNAYAATTGQAVVFIHDMFVNAGYDVDVLYDEEDEYYVIWVASSDDMLAIALSALDGDADGLYAWEYMKLRFQFISIAVKGAIGAFDYERHDIMIALSTGPLADEDSVVFYMFRMEEADTAVYVYIDEVTNESGYLALDRFL